VFRSPPNQHSPREWLDMEAEGFRINRLALTRLFQAIRQFAVSEVGGKAKAMFAGLIIFLFGINGLNVVNSYVGRDFMTAIERRSMSGFIWKATVYLGVFAASTVVAVIYRFTEERLALLWREWLSRNLITLYLEHPIYYRLNDRLIENAEIANPDERITDDVRAFTAITLSVVLMFLNGTFTVVAFSGVMWSISPLLFGVAVSYAACGSLLAIVLGRRLIQLNYIQPDKEANLRSELIHIRDNGESVALLRCEGHLRARVLRRLEEVTGNLRRIIAVNRNLGFFTTGYNYLIQLIPALIVAPLFIRGKAEFGVITQSAMAFSHLLGAFSLIVTQFQSISSLAAVAARLSSLGEASDQARSARVPAIEVRLSDDWLAYEKLTLRSPEDGRLLVKELTVSVPSGTRLLVVGSNETAKVAFLRATAGLWDTGEGCIFCPDPNQILFLPERPYLPPGTLRELLVQAGQENAVLEERVLATLHVLYLEPLVVRAGGLDVDHDWNNILSRGERQLLNVARILLAAPRFAFLDLASTALGERQVGRILTLLSERSITYVNLGQADDQLGYYDALLELADDGGWKWKWVRAGRVVEEV